jgi:type III restriction enzyme
MSQVIIENPILNSPFTEPSRHFRFGEEGITNETAETIQKKRGEPVYGVEKIRKALGLD